MGLKLNHSGDAGNQEPSVLLSTCPGFSDSGQGQPQGVGATWHLSPLASSARSEVAPLRGMTGLSPTPSRTRDQRRRWAALPAGCGHLVLTGIRSPVGTWEEGPSFPQSPVGQSFKSPREATGKRGVWVLSRVRRRGPSLLLSTMGTHACPGIPRAS